MIDKNLDNTESGHPSLAKYGMKLPNAIENVLYDNKIDFKNKYRLHRKNWIRYIQLAAIVNVC